MLGVAGFVDGWRNRNSCYESWMDVMLVGEWVGRWMERGLGWIAYMCIYIVILQE